MKNSLAVRLPPKMRRELARVAKERGVELSTLVREALQKLIALHGFENLRTDILPSAKRAGIITDDDVFCKIKS